MAQQKSGREDKAAHAPKRFLANLPPPQVSVVGSSLSRRLSLSGSTFTSFRRAIGSREALRQKP
jgi:hypothetical protein